MSNLHPGLILIASGIIALILPDKIRKWVTVAMPALALAAMLSLNESSEMNYVFNRDITMEILHVDGLSRIFGLGLCAIAVVAGIYSFGKESRGERCASLIYAGSSLGVVFAGDWITLIFFWEAMALSSSYMVWSGRSHSATRASYRYLVMHLVGGNLLLAGAISLCWQGNFEIGMLTDASGYGYTFVLLGMLINAAVPPLHTWIPDAYPEATPYGTLYMGSYTTKVAIYALIRVFAGTENLIIIGALMAVFGACMAIIENDLRRLLAYHIVSQLGMMVAALATGSAVGMDGAALHAVFNMLYKGVLLMGAGVVFVATGKRKISELGGLWKKMPLISVCFLIASLAISGMPLLNGFVSKALIMESLHDYTASYWLVNMAGIGTWLSITLKINYFVFFGKSDKKIECNPVPVNVKIALVLGTAMCILSGIFPDFIYQFTPNGSTANVFEINHILEYLGMFIGATVSFVIFIKRMTPHDKITIDFDWIYRRPLCRMVFGISRWVNRKFEAAMDIAENSVFIIKVMLNTPSQIFNKVAERHKNEEEEPISEFMQIFIVFCMITFIIALLLE